MQVFNNKQAASSPTDSIIISGTVKGPKGDPLENAVIVFGEYKFLSDKNGHFQFTLPTAVNKPAVIQFFYSKLESTVRSYHPAMGFANYEVQLFEPYMPEYIIMGGITAFYQLPERFSTLTFLSPKFEAKTKEFLSTLATYLKDHPNITLSLKSYYKTSPKKAAALSKQVKSYLVDAEGVGEERITLTNPQQKKKLRAEVIIEFGQPDE